MKPMCRKTGSVLLFGYLVVAPGLNLTDAIDALNVRLCCCCLISACFVAAEIVCENMPARHRKANVCRIMPSRLKVGDCNLCFTLVVMLKSHDMLATHSVYSVNRIKCL
jgi:hypothetical protein